MACEAPKPFLASAPVWQEFGRPSPDEAQTWITWVAPIGEDGDAVYRSLWLADGAVAVTVDLHVPGQAGVQTIHRGRCRLPGNQDQAQTAGRIHLLLGMSDRAVAGFRSQSNGSRDAVPHNDGEGATRTVLNGLS